jgi:phospholipase C
MAWPSSPEPLDAELSNGDNLANAVKADVVAGTLAQISWVVTKPGSGLTVTASYYAHGFDDKPKLILVLFNGTGSDVTFTVTPNFYSRGLPETVKVRAHGRWGHGFDAVATSHGWYDVTVTVSSDPTWSQRFIGHIETGEDSVTGSF